MYTMSLVILSSLLLGASANPVVARNPQGPILPVALWNLTTFEGDNCDGTLIHNFEGSGSQSCDVLTGSAPSTPPGINVEPAGSVLAQTLFGTYDFSFFPDEVCDNEGSLQRLYEIDGQTCISLGDLSPESFNVTFVNGDLKARTSLPVEARQGPLDTWGASSFTSADCTGDAVISVGGTNATSCNVVPTSEPCCPVIPGRPTCDCIREVSVGSLLVVSDQGTHSFTIFGGDETCTPNGLEDAVYLVSAGENLCITLPEDSEHSYQVETIE